jgi:hypothetical protein
MLAAVQAGAGMINDVYALRSEGALDMAVSLGVPVCLMHMQGKPRSMQQKPEYQDVVAEVSAFLLERANALLAAGAAAAEASGCDALVTRDPDGYPNAPLPVIDPAAALSWLTLDRQ